MSKEICPLFQRAQKDPQAPFLITASKTYTYLDLEEQTEFLVQKHQNEPLGSVFSTPLENLFFCSSLLWATLRLGHIFFPLSKRLPSNTISEYTKKAKVTHSYLKPTYGRAKNTKGIIPYIQNELPLTYLLTSGSTSAPKICVHSYLNHKVSAITSNEHLNFKPKKVWLHSLPLYHVSGLSLIFRTICSGASLLEKSDNIEKTLENNSLSHISLVPTQLKRLINNSNLKKLECILLGGAPLSPSLIEQAKANDLNIYSTYGLTEMASQVFTHCPKQNKVILLPQREFMLTKDKELLVKGPTLFMGYLKNQSIESPVDPDGWYPTKDLAQVNEKGFYFLGRKDNLFISGGENIQPEEIERILLLHPHIQEAIVLPYPDPEYGHRPYALVKSSNQLEKPQLDSFLELRLPKYKWPIFYGSLHYNGLKPNRKVLISKMLLQTKSTF